MKKKLLKIAGFGYLLLPIAVTAAVITPVDISQLPHRFQNGDYADANAVNENFERLRSSVEAVNENVVTVNEQQESHQTAIETLDQQVEVLQSEIPEMRNEVASLGIRVDQLSSRVSNLTGQISALSSQVANLNAQFASLSDAVAGSIFNMEIDIEGLNSDLTEFATNVDNIDLKLTGLDMKIMDVDVRATDAESKLQDIITTLESLNISTNPLVRFSGSYRVYGVEASVSNVQEPSCGYQFEYFLGSIEHITEIGTATARDGILTFNTTITRRLLDFFNEEEKDEFGEQSYEGVNTRTDVYEETKGDHFSAYVDPLGNIQNDEVVGSMAADGNSFVLQYTKGSGVGRCGAYTGHLWGVKVIGGVE